MSDKKAPYAVVLMPDPVERDLVALTLLRLHCGAVACKDIFAAEEAIQNHPVDLLIMDIILPGASGIDLIREWKSWKNMENCRIIVISAMRFAEIVTQAKLAGASDFLVKPVDVDMILKRVGPLVKQ